MTLFMGSPFCGPGKYRAVTSLRILYGAVDHGGKEATGRVGAPECSLIRVVGEVGTP